MAWSSFGRPMTRQSGTKTLSGPMLPMGRYALIINRFEAGN